MTLGQWIVLTGGGPRQPAPVAEATCQEVIVSQVRVHNFSVSLDGFGTGGGKAWRPRSGMREPGCTSGSSRPVPSAPCRASPAAAPASTTLSPAPGTGHRRRDHGPGQIGPHHGPWPDQEWTGWWGDNPPFRTPVFVLTHYLRPSVRMNGGTTFDFLDASPAQALAQARQAAAGADIRIGGGPATSANSWPPT